MLQEWAAIFFFLALGAAAFGFTGIAEGATEIAKILFYIFLAIFVLLLLAELALPRRLRQRMRKWRIWRFSHSSRLGILASFCQRGRLFASYTKIP